jgi:hypothetical protein
VVPAPRERGDPVRRDGLGGSADVACGDVVAHRVRDQSLLEVPLGRPAVQFGGVAPTELQAQEVGEEVVVAVPLALAVERDEEEVRALDAPQHLGRVVAPGDGVAQRRAQPIQDARAQQELPHVRRLPVEHLVGEVVDDVAVVAGEARHGRRGIVASAQSQSGEVQAGGPALGALDQAADVVGAQREALPSVEQVVGLLAIEAQLVDGDLGELAAAAKPGQRQRGLGAREERELELGWGVLEQERDGFVHVRVRDEVVVVEDEHHRLGQAGELVE